MVSLILTAKGVLADAPQKDAVDLVGTLRTGVVAIGAETFDATLTTADRATYELDFSADPKFIKAAASLSGQKVHVTGSMYTIRRVETPGGDRTIVKVTLIEKAPTVSATAPTQPATQKRNTTNIAMVSTSPSTATTRSDVSQFVDAKLMEKAEVVVRGTCTPIPAGAGKGGWPQYTLAVSHVYKPEDDPAIMSGVALTLIALEVPDKEEATFYLRSDANYPPGYYRLIGGADLSKSISHVAKDAPVEKPSEKPATGPATGPFSQSTSRHSPASMTSPVGT